MVQLGRPPGTTSVLVHLLTVALLVGSGSVWGHDTPLEQWLYGLVFPVPPLTGGGLLHVNISQLSCTHVAVGSLSLVPGPPATMEWQVLISGLDTTCAGQFAWLEGRDHPLSLVLTDSRVAFTVQLVTSAQGIPSDLTYVRANNFLRVIALDIGNLTLPKEVQAALDDVVDLGLDDFAKNLTRTLVSALGLTLQRLAVQGKHWLPERPPQPPPPVPADAFSLLTDKGLHFIDTVLDQWLNDTWDKLVDRVTPALPGEISVPVPPGLLKVSFPFAPTHDANITIEIVLVNVSGLDQIGLIDVLRPTTATSLASRLQLGKASIAVCVAVSSGGAVPLTAQHLWLSVALGSAMLNATTTVALSPAVVAELALLEYLQPGCLAKAVQVLNITQLFMWLDAPAVYLAWPAAPINSLETQVAVFVNATIAAFLTSFGPHVLSELLRGFVAWEGQDTLNADLATFLYAQDNSSCVDHMAEATAAKARFFFNLAVGLLPTSVFLGLMFSATVLRRKRRQCGLTSEVHKPLLSNSLPASTSLRPCLLISDPQVASWIAYTVPPLFCYVVVSLAVAHTAVLAQAEATLSVDGQTLQTIIVEYLTNFKTIQQFQQAGVYVFYILVLMGAVITPYAQILGVAIIWLAPLPTRYATVAVRLLNASCKLCFFEVFIPVLIPTAVFYILRAESAELLIAIFPRGATYVYLTFCMASLALINLTLVAHVQSCAPAMAMKGANSQPCAISRAAVRGDGVTLAEMTCGRKGRYGVAAGLVLNGAVIAFAVSAPVCRFIHKGLAGVALRQSGAPVAGTFSLIQLDFPEYYNPVWIIHLYLAIMSVVIAFLPMVHCATLLILWLRRMSAPQRQGWWLVNECLRAWSSTEVFVVCVAAVYLELRNFVLFIFGPYCQGLNAVLAEYFSADLDNDPCCYDVAVSIEYGFYLWTALAAINILLRNIVLRASRNVDQVKHDKHIE